MSYRPEFDAKQEWVLIEPVPGLPVCLTVPPEDVATVEDILPPSRKLWLRLREHGEPALYRVAEPETLPDGPGSWVMFRLSVCDD